MSKPLLRSVPVPTGLEHWGGLPAVSEPSLAPLGLRGTHHRRKQEEGEAGA